MRYMFLRVTRYRLAHLVSRLLVGNGYRKVFAGELEMFSLLPESGRQRTGLVEASSMCCH